MSLVVMDESADISIGDAGTLASGIDGGQMGTESVVLKLLLPEKETGHVIGKGGGILTKIKLDSGARIRISAIDEVLPVSRERVCTIVGSLPSVLLAQRLVSNALVENARPSMAEPAASVRTLKLLLTHAAVGCVIGRGGALIKELMLQTGAVVKASQPAELILATNERWLAVSGEAEAVDQVVAAVMAQLLQSPAPPRATDVATPPRSAAERELS